MVDIINARGRNVGSRMEHFVNRMYPHEIKEANKIAFANIKKAGNHSRLPFMWINHGNKGVLIIGEPGSLPSGVRGAISHANHAGTRAAEVTEYGILQVNKAPENQLLFHRSFKDKETLTAIVAKYSSKKVLFTLTIGGM